MTWKYKKAYELLAEFVFSEQSTLRSVDKEWLSYELDLIFGEERRC